MTASIWKTEGPRGFFKGLMTPLVSLSLISSITFPCYSWFRVQFGAQRGWDVKNALAGFVCAPITFPITNLEGVVKVRISWKEYKSHLHCTPLSMFVFVNDSHGLAPNLYINQVPTSII